MDLLDAVIMNDIEGTLNLLCKGVDPNYTEDEAKITPLHFAAQYGHFDIAKLLITAGAKIDAATNDGYTPFDLAKLHEHGPLIQLFSKLKLSIISNNVAIEANEIVEDK